MVITVCAWHGAHPVDVQSTQGSRRNGSPQIHPLPSLRTCTVLPPASAQLLHRAGSPAPHSFVALSLLHGTVNPGLQVPKQE